MMESTDTFERARQAACSDPAEQCIKDQRHAAFPSLAITGQPPPWLAHGMAGAGRTQLEATSGHNNKLARCAGPAVQLPHRQSQSQSIRDGIQYHVI